MLRIDILTLFPEMFEGALNESIIKRAQEKRLVKIDVLDLRSWSADRHKKADDKPYGGGPGMILTCQPIFDAVSELKEKGSIRQGRTRLRREKEKVRIVLLSPRGKKFNQKLADRLAKQKHLILICGHYEGVDERVKEIISEEISIGDYVLTGGEIPAMAVADAVVRLVPGVLGNKESLISESFRAEGLEYPQYTRPRVYKGLKVPAVLLTGNHENIAEWRRRKSKTNVRKA